MKINNVNKKIAGAGALLVTLGLMGATVATTVNAATVTNDLTTSSQRMERQMSPKLEDVTRTVANTTNGVTITMTSTDADTVTKLQAGQQPTDQKDANVTVTQSNITNGVQITMSSTDAATVTKLQDQAANGHGGFGGGRGGFGGGHGGPGGDMFDKNVTRTATKIFNGIELTMTSTDAATVTKLQSEKRPDAPADSKVTVTQTNIADGVQVTMTSTDADTVTKLQSMPQGGPGRHEHDAASASTTASQ